MHQSATVLIRCVPGSSTDDIVEEKALGTRLLLSNVESFSSHSYFYVPMVVLEYNVFMILFADDEGVLNTKDIEWSSKHISTELSAVEESQLPADDQQSCE